MDLGIRGKVALVGASSQGLGRAVARELAAEGAVVVLCARGAGALEEARAAIAAETGAEVRAVTADLAWPGEAGRVVEQALGDFGRVDILVTNTGGPPSGPFEAHDGAAWQAAYDLLLRAPLELARGVLPGMKARGWGRIITITSIAVKQPVEGLVLSNSLRAALAGLARTLANEVARDGITVNNVLPGYTETGRIAQIVRDRTQASGQSADAVLAGMRANVPAGRFAQPEEIGGVIAFLCSPAAGYVNGVSLAVDGARMHSI